MLFRPRVAPFVFSPPCHSKSPPRRGFPLTLRNTALNLTAKPKAQTENMKRKVWMLVQHLLPKRNSQSWEPNRKALAYQPWNMSATLRGHYRLVDKLSVLSEQRHVRRIRNYFLDAETGSVSSVFITRGYLRSNAQNRHPFHHLPWLARPVQNSWLRHCVTNSN